MRNLNKICCLFLVSILMLIFVACSPNVSEDDSTESVITEYVTTYYTITNDDIELYKKIVGGNKDVNVHEFILLKPHQNGINCSSFLQGSGPI